MTDSFWSLQGILVFPNLFCFGLLCMFFFFLFFFFRIFVKWNCITLFASISVSENYDYGYFYNNIINTMTSFHQLLSFCYHIILVQLIYFIGGHYGKIYIFFRRSCHCCNNRVYCMHEHTMPTVTAAVS